MSKSRLAAPNIGTSKFSGIPDFPSLGESLRALREARGLALRQVGVAVAMDSTLLSKIELGQRLPTREQAGALATFFEVSVDEMEAARIAEKFWRSYAGNPAAELAVARIQETAVEYQPKGRPSS